MKKTLFLAIVALLLLSSITLAARTADDSVKCAFMSSKLYPEYTGLTNEHRCQSFYNKAIGYGLWVPGYKTYKTMYTVYVKDEPVEVDFAMAGKTSSRYVNVRTVLFTQEFLDSMQG